VLLEMTFFFLVFICATRPIIVQIPLTSAEVKGSFTMIFILWHALAILLLSDATSLAFSSEWSLLHAKTGLLVPGETDRVSVLTSGNLDKAQYFFTRKSTNMFCVAFVVSMVLAALNSFAPGTLSIGQVKALVDRPLHIADLRFVSSSQDEANENNFNYIQIRADILTLLEQHEGFTVKYDAEPNWFMAWPDDGSINSDIVGILEYPTDVIHFNYSCEWTIPDMEVGDGVTTWRIGGQAWKIWSNPGPLREILYVGGELGFDYNQETFLNGMQASCPCIDTLTFNLMIVLLSLSSEQMIPSLLSLTRTGVQLST
jgi:hypothetical protein